VTYWVEIRMRFSIKRATAWQKLSLFSAMQDANRNWNIEEQCYSLTLTSRQKAT
jgi:hypothetical protein